jgi:phospholipid/cholesterol/gamma-HCH transport system substrate-binding protein
VSARTHPRLVGVFVLGAVGLVLAAIVVLSSGGWLHPRDRFTVFFPGSVSGLNSGSPITFRGVRIGQVVDVSPLLTAKPDDPIQIEVAIEFAGEVVQVPPGMADPFANLDTEGLGRLLIERGIRGRLVSQSLLTGQKAIDFDFLPDQPARFGGVNPRFFELPTTPTAFERLSARFEGFSEKLADLPLDQMLEDVRNVIQSAREVLGSEDVQKVFASARRAADRIDATLREAQKTLEESQGLIRRLDTEAGSLGQESRETLGELRERLGHTQRVLDSLDATLRGADETRMELAGTFSEMERAMRALRNLVDYIQTHPEAVIQGKKPQKESR